jgi:hypothetical protein
LLKEARVLAVAGEFTRNFIVWVLQHKLQQWNMPIGSDPEAE